jgi:hypothetical protein
VQSSAFAIPGDIKQPGVLLNLKLSLEAEPFPTGTTTILMELSLDGGATWKGAPMAFTMPHTFRGPAPHFWNVGYTLGPNDNPTHGRFTTIAPSAFTTNIVLEAV